MSVDAASLSSAPTHVDGSPAETVATQRWPETARRRLGWTVAGDLVAAQIACTAALVLAPGAAPLDVTVSAVVSAAAAATWVALLALGRAYEPGPFLVGNGWQERRVLRSLVTLVAIVASVSWLLHQRDLGEYALVAVPLLGILSVAHRRGSRWRRARRRTPADGVGRVLAVGDPLAVRHLVARLRSGHAPVLEVVAACTASGIFSGELADLGVPVVGDITGTCRAVEALQVDGVVVLPCAELGELEIRRLAWSLEKTKAELVVVPQVVGVGGSRVRVYDVAGSTVLHVGRPELDGPHKWIKAALDVVLAAVGIVLMAPILAAICLAIVLDSPGPVLFRQTRVGRDGRPFTMLKFRTMVVDAERLLAELTAQNEGKGLLFKMREDPRVTRVGSVLRRTSLDELPQLFNVLRGEMSLVGPRPPLPQEVQQYEDDVRRRLLVKPGITGLWQVSGRSDLAWEDAVRLDLEYVESWSIGMDAKILGKTVSAVIGGNGAY